jgi:transposase InsO family protein
MIVLVACHATLDSLGLARLLRDHVWSRFGTPRLIISDRGPQFASRFTKDLSKVLGIELAISTAYHPQSDGQSERMNQEIEKYLRAYVNYHQNDWTEWLAPCQFAINNTVKSSTGYTPFELNLGRHPNPGNVPHSASSEMPAVEDFIKGLAKAQENAQKALVKAADDMKKFADRKRAPTPSFEIGQLVMLSSTNLSTDRPSKKLADKWEGPFKIIEKISTHNYKLELPDQWKIHPVFHVDKLRPYNQDPKNPNHIRPPPDLVNNEEEYEVEKIIDSSYRRGILHYKISWVGYPLSEATWIRADKTDNMKEIVDKWYKENPDSPRSLKPDKPPAKKGGRRQKIKVLGTDKEIEGELNFRPLQNDTNVQSWPDGPLTRDELA